MPLGLQQITPPAKEPLTATAAKRYLRIDGDDDNPTVSDLISEARSYCEIETGRQFLTATWRLTLDHFPNRLRVHHPTSYRREWQWVHGRWYEDDKILVPRPPLQSVTSITYVDTTGITQTLDPSKYVVDNQNEPGRIAPAYGTFWPDTQVILNAVQVTFVAGWATADLVPVELKRAMKMLLAHWYDHRESVAVGAGDPVAQALDSLLYHHKVIRFL